MKRRILPEQVTKGMYVCGFGGSWIDHPFWRIRFILKSQKDIERIRKSDVPYVLIDDEKGATPGEPVDEARPMPARVAPVRSIQNPRRSASSEYGNPIENHESTRAAALVSRSTKTMRRIFDSARLGKAVRLDEVLDIVDDIATAVERSPRTLLGIVRLKKKDEYTYLHSVAVCTLMVNVARFMGKSDAEVREFGLAGLLHDIGKMGIPDTVLKKPGRLTDAEFQIIRNHPEHGFNLLSETPDISGVALDVCRHHHEKMDGTGYPFGMAGDAISVPARMGAICDVYDALTSDRVYKEASPPLDALAAMWSWEGHFDRELLFTFMRSIDVYLPNMLIELRSNRLGIVLESKRRNARPRVLAFYSTRERGFIEPEEIEIQDTLASDSIIALATPEEWGLDNWEQEAQRLTVNRR